MMNKTLDLELLRAFVAVVDGGGFTRAARHLHRTQSTISQQIKRLEERVGLPLLQRNTRYLAATEQGELLLGYAKRLLALNDEAIAALSATQLQGTLRLGAVQEVADGGLADLLAHFTRLHPDVALEVRVGANLLMREQVERGELDLAVLFQEPGQSIPGNVSCEVVARMRRVWVAAVGYEPPTTGTLPLVLSNGPCIFRNAMLSALDNAGQPWRIILSTPSLSGLRAALRAGLGVGARTERWLEPDLRILSDELPPLPDVELVILARTDANAELLERLRTALLTVLQPYA